MEEEWKTARWLCLYFRKAFQGVNPFKALDSFGLLFPFRVEMAFETLVILGHEFLRSDDSRVREPACATSEPMDP